MARPISTARRSSRPRCWIALLIARSAQEDASLSQGVEFFSFLRNLTADGFFTSKIGIQYLGYIGNGYLAEFPGCPPVPGV